MNGLQRLLFEGKKVGDNEKNVAQHRLWTFLQIRRSALWKRFVLEVEKTTLFHQKVHPSNNIV